MAKTSLSLTVVSKEPTGLTIARDGYKFICGWKRGDSYTAQQFQFISADKWLTASGITASQTTHTVTLSASGHYPNNSTKLGQFAIRIRGKKDGEWSSWTMKTFVLSLPPKPSVSYTPDDSLSNRCTFSWSASTSATNSQHFANVEYQTILFSNCNTTDGEGLPWNAGQTGWQTGTGGASGSITITESNVSTGSHTRWFRVRSRGMAGDSDWAYTYRVYASPAAASNVNVSTTQTGAGGTDVLVGWNAAETVANPIGEVTAEYAVVTPAAGLTCPVGATWTSGNIAADTSGSDNALVKIDTQAGEDECIFVRVNTMHENRITYGSAKLAKIGFLKAPTLTQVTPNYNNNIVSFTVASTTAVSGAYTECFYRTQSKPNQLNKLGNIANGSTTGSFTIPDLSGETSVAYGIRSRVDADSNSMYSTEVWSSSYVPTAPTELTLGTTDIAGTISAKWNWTWVSATGLELSWADHEDAWYSTDEPETFKVSDRHATEWRISGLETGKKWYVRVRLMQEDEDTTIYSPWSDIKMIDLSSIPARPVVALAKGIVPITGDVTAYWTYVSGDGTNQVYAEICEAEISGDTITYGTIIAHTQSAQQITIPASTWTAGTTHHLCVRTLSGSNHKSEWSAPVSVTIATPLTAVISATSLSSGELTALPLTATITGAGAGGTTTLAIERADDYHIVRPTDIDFNGYKGETIALTSQTGEAQISITQEMLYGSLDDGAPYRLVATVQDGLGQTDTATLDFTVNWSHKAGKPTGTVTIINDTVAKLRATAPSGYVSGDTCDIYRLSADLPELVVKGAAFGTDYIDPYPAIGGGYRFVTITANGDYITSNGEIAWVDVLSDFTYDRTLIDFNGIQIPLYYNLDLSNAWEKDFQHTRYLGGSVKGDWNEGVYRTASLSTIAFTEYDEEVIAGLKVLAEYTGICTIRTLDGSCYKANLEVKEDRDHADYGVRANFSITGQRIDPQELDGIEFALWNS